MILIGIRQHVSEVKELRQIISHWKRKIDG